MEEGGGGGTEQLEREVAALRAALEDKEAQLQRVRQPWGSHETQQSLQTLTPVYDIKKFEAPVLDVCPQDQVNEGLPRWAIERYSRQILLSQIGVEGQEKLCNAGVLVVGAGGLGCPAAAYLAGAGVGKIGIVDYDTVDVTNLHRQLLHSEGNQGVNKADSAAAAIARLNSRVSLQPYNVQLTSTNALQVLSGYDVVLDCTDNVPTRYLLNDSCVLLKIPLISGGALKLEGQLTIYGYRTTKTEKEPQFVGPCYRCLFPRPPPPETVGSCSSQGVAGPVPGVMGTLQALEAVKLLTGRPQKDLLVSRMLLFDGEDTSFRTIKLRAVNPECAACSENPTVTRLLDYEQFCKTQAKEKKKKEARQKSLRRSEEKIRRMSGRAYFGFRKTKLDDKEKWIQDVPKGERKMGPPCKSEFCAKGISKLCTVLSEEQRHVIFSQFWNEMDWLSKKSFVKSLVDSTPPKRRRLKHKGETSRKGDSKVYHLMNNNERVPVCRVMFLNTLGIKEAMVRCWLTSDDVGDKPRGPKKKPIKTQNVERYLDGLPKVPPKCDQCRAFTTRLYLEPGVKNQHQLYNRYVQDMRANGISPASRKTFAKVFAVKEVLIFRPKKESDVCDLFSQHNQPSVPVFQQVSMNPQQMAPLAYIETQW